MKPVLLTLFILIPFSFLNAQPKSVVYPKASTGTDCDTFFSKVIPNPYKWMEDQSSKKVKAWVDEENAYTYTYLKEIPLRFNVQERIKKNTYYSSLAPRKIRKYFIEARTDYEFKAFDFYYNDDLINGQWQQLSVVKGLKNDENEVLSLRGYNLSSDSKFIAFSFSRNGSDWREIKVAEIKSGKVLSDHLINIKFTQIVWKGNGFYYMRYDSINDVSKSTDQVKYQRVYYHKLGDDQKKDSLVFKRNDAPFNIFSLTISDDERYLVIEDKDHVKNTQSYYYNDFNAKELKGLRPIMRNTHHHLEMLDYKSDTLIFKNRTAGQMNIVAIDLKNPKKLIALLPEFKDAVFRDGFYVNRQLFIIADQDAEEKLIVFDKNKVIKKVIAFPFGTHYSFLEQDREKNKLFMSYESFLHPAVLLSFDLSTYKFEVLKQAKVNYESQDYEINKVVYQSDTANIPMLLMHKKGIKLDGNNPVLMEFYGGFGISYSASFDPAKIMFIENGGIYAYPLIRGGGELGPNWHQAGILFNKKNSINDIANAAIFLIDKKYTNSKKIAITGGSHGGLMSAAVAMKYPELFKVVIPVVGVYDMLKAENYTVGGLHTDEFGTVKDSAQFLNLLSYSPLHCIKENVEYPSMLIMTSDHDDRVPPLHSYKFAAALQAKNSKNILLRVEKNAGHNGGAGYDNYIRETVDFYTFLFYNLGFEKLGKY